MLCAESAPLGRNAARRRCSSMAVIEFCGTFGNRVETPIGILSVIHCKDGLHSMKFEDGTFKADDLRTQVALLDAEWSNNEVSNHLSDCLDWLDAYFTSPNVMADKPKLCSSICSSDGSFMEKVWYTIMHDVGFGHRVSYKEVASLVQTPKAARAVGSAMRKNPFILLVPCHRVIKSDGSLGNYDAGKRNQIKRWLLDYESSITPKYG